MCPSKLVNSSPLPYHTRVVTPDGAGKIISYDPYHGYYTVQLDGTPDESCVEEYYPSQVSVEVPLDVTVKKTVSSCKVGDAVLTDHGKGTVIANDYDQNGNYCKVLLESGEVIYTTDIYEKISPKIYPLDATGRTISRGDLVQCVNSNVQGRVTNISYVNNTWYCSFVHDKGIVTTLAAYPSQDLRIVEESPEEKSPEEKSPEQMFPEQKNPEEKNPEEKSPAPKLKVGDRVYTMGYGLGTIRRYDKHSNTYDVVDDFGYVRGEFKEEELTSAGTCTTPEEQKETPPERNPSP